MRGELEGAGTEPKGLRARDPNPTGSCTTITVIVFHGVITPQAAGSRRLWLRGNLDGDVSENAEQRWTVVGLTAESALEESCDTSSLAHVMPLNSALRISSSLFLNEQSRHFSLTQHP